MSNLDQCYLCPVDERYTIEYDSEGYSTGYGDYHGCCVGCLCDAITDVVESIMQVRAANYWRVEQWWRWD